MGLCALAMLATACGTRLSQKELAATRASAADGSARTADTPTATDDGTTDAGSSAIGGQPTPQGSRTAAATSSKSPTSGGAQQDTRPVVIGNVGTLSGPAGATLKFTTDALRVWVRWVNDHGGIHGRPVELITGDDGGDASRHRSLVQQFVEQRGVIAFVGNPEGLSGSGSVDYLTRAQVPVIGSEGSGQWFYQSPVYFPQVTTGTAVNQGFAYGIASEMKRRNLTKVATIMCLEAQICRDQHAKSPALFQKFGVNLVYRAQVSIAQPDFTAECVNARGKGAQVLFAGMDANSIGRLAASCARQGYHPAIASSASTIVSQHRSDPNFEGAIVLSGAQWAAQVGDATKEFRDAVAIYAPGVEITGAHAAGWVAGKLFEMAATHAAQPLTRTSLLTALWSIHDDRMADMTGPFLFNPHKPATPAVCGFSTTIQKGKWVPLNGGQRECTAYDPAI